MKAREGRGRGPLSCRAWPCNALRVQGLGAGLGAGQPTAPFMVAALPTSPHLMAGATSQPMHPAAAHEPPTAAPSPSPCTRRSHAMCQCAAIMQPMCSQCAAIVQPMCSQCAAFVQPVRSHTPTTICCRAHTRRGAPCSAPCLGLGAPGRSGTQAWSAWHCCPAWGGACVCAGVHMRVRVCKSVCERVREHACVDASVWVVKGWALEWSKLQSQLAYCDAAPRCSHRTPPLHHTGCVLTCSFWAEAHFDHSRAQPHTRIHTHTLKYTHTYACTPGLHDA